MSSTAMQITNHPGTVLSDLAPRAQDACRERLALLTESMTWSAREMKAYQLAQLRRIVDRAYRRVPYYRRSFDAADLQPADVATLADIQRLPPIDKTVVRNHHADFITGDADLDGLSYMTTGGSAGDPLKIMMDDRFKGLNHANTWFYLWTVGYEPETHPSVRLHGNTIDQDLVDRGQYWVEEGLRLTMSVYHIDQDTTPAFVERINAHRPEYIHAYPSALSLLCHYIDILGLEVIDTMQWAFIDSETIFPWQRALIERVLNCRTFSIYGHTEGAGLAFTCKECGMMRVAPLVGLMEILDPDGTQVKESGGTGEIVVTGFNNDVFPLIRYRTGDLATLAPESNCLTCNNAGMRFSEVKGRIQDYVVNRNGARTAIAPALFDYNFDWSHIDRFQIYQDTPGVLLFRIVAARDAVGQEEALKRRIIESFGAILNRQFEIDAEIVNDIPHTARGKYRYVDQRLEITDD